ncbi:hypothetical protein BH20ACT6_BH20ACT6_10940 [soil metagenome]
MLDVVRLVALLAVGIVVVAWLGGLFRPDTAVEPVPVDYLAVAATARDEAGFTLVVPDELPDGWRATSARWEPAEARWHLGVLTADDEYVGLEQVSGDAATARAAYAPDATEAGAVNVAGRPWLRLVEEETGAVALLDERRASTLVVTGSAPEPTLTGFAERLPAPGSWAG